METIASSLSGAPAKGFGSISGTWVPTTYGRLIRSDPVAAKVVDIVSAARRLRPVVGTRLGARGRIELQERAEDDIVVLAMSLLCRHPNVLPLVQVCAESTTELAVCTPLAAGCLLDAVTPSPCSTMPTREVLPDSIPRRWFSDTVWGLGHLASELGVVPVDLSIENILVFFADGPRAASGPKWEASVAVLADFGQVAQPGSSVSVRCGKQGCRAPECFWLHEDRVDALPACAFQLGVVLFTILARAPPFVCASLSDRRFATLVTGELQPSGLSARRYAELAGGPRPQLAYLSKDRCKGVRALVAAYGMTDRFPPAAVELLAGLLDPSPRTRATLGDVAASPWVLPQRCADELPASLRFRAPAAPASSSSSAAAAADASPALTAMRPDPTLPAAPDCVMRAARSRLALARRARKACPLAVSAPTTPKAPLPGTPAGPATPSTAATSSSAPSASSATDCPAKTRPADPSGPAVVRACPLGAASADARTPLGRASRSSTPAKTEASRLSGSPDAFDDDADGGPVPFCRAGRDRAAELRPPKRPRALLGGVVAAGVQEKRHTHLGGGAGGSSSDGAPAPPGDSHGAVGGGCAGRGGVRGRG